MSLEHISDLRVKLENSKWKIIEEISGDDYSISAIWKISRLNGEHKLNIVFEGLNEKAVLPIEKSYGCHILENQKINLYFNKISKGYVSDLNNFINELSVSYT